MKRSSRNSIFNNPSAINQYQAEERWSQIIGYASALTILIACPGLFGLATLAVTNRIKEIGIRKVLGASVPDMVQLVSIDFIKLVAIAAVFAWPMAYFGISRWLAAFTYRIDIGPWTFLLAAPGEHSYRAGDPELSCDTRGPVQPGTDAEV
jgi:ABC-type antimicrobial peptide transport system permease subunit